MTRHPGQSKGIRTLLQVKRQEIRRYCLKLVEGTSFAATASQWRLNTGRLLRCYDVTSVEETVQA